MESEPKFNDLETDVEHPIWEIWDYQKLKIGIFESDGVKIKAR